MGNQYKPQVHFLIIPPDNTRVAMPPVPTTITTQAVSASTLLNKVVHWDGSPRDIELVLNAAFDAKDYLDCILNLPARNIDPLLYINSLDKVCSRSVFGRPSIHRGMTIDHR